MITRLHSAEAAPIFTVTFSKSRYPTTAQTFLNMGAGVTVTPAPRFFIISHTYLTYQRWAAGHRANQQKTKASSRHRRTASLRLLREMEHHQPGSQRTRIHAITPRISDLAREKCSCKWPPAQRKTPLDTLHNPYIIPIRLITGNKKRGKSC